MRIPMSIPEITEDDVKAVTEVVRSSWVSGIAPIVDKFEKAFAEYCGVDYGVVTNSGTTALHLALASLNIGPGDEVIVPTFTMVASVNPILYLGAKPVFVDSLPDTWCIDPESVKERITPKTKAIIPVHIYGHPCDMGALRELSFDHELDLVEDCAEAHGAEYKRRKVGWFGRAGVFSLYANKIITTGEGGIITTNDEELYEKMKWLRAHAFGRHGKHYHHEEIGYGYRMSAMSAALGYSQLQRIDYYGEKRRLDAWLYRKQLKELETDGLVTFPVELQGYRNVYWMFSLLLNEEFPLPRKQLLDELAEAGVDNRTFFYPVHQLPVHKTDESFPVAEDLSRRGLNLPSGNAITKNDILTVCETIKHIIGY